VNDLAQYDRWTWWSPDDRVARVLARLVPARMRPFRRVVGSFADLDVLDLSCGGGLQSEALAREGARVVGLDRSPGALATAREHARAGGLAIRYVEGSADALPFEPASFDAVVGVDVLEHLGPLVGPTLREVARVLRPGGWFLYDTLARTAAAYWLGVRLAEDVLRWVPPGTHDWALFLSPDDLEARLRATGLRAQGRQGLGPVAVDHRLEPFFGWWPTLAVQWLGWARPDAERDDV
jgi:2-polyprenyl-6-hydroxyphenyl methylase/3-demethylubiquinone-9 3-methyltransferase